MNLVIKFFCKIAFILEVFFLSALTTEFISKSIFSDYQNIDNNLINTISIYATVIITIFFILFLFSAKPKTLYVIGYFTKILYLYILYLIINTSIQYISFYDIIMTASMLFFSILNQKMMHEDIKNKKNDHKTYE